jgi:hypothetical protein
MTLAQQGGLLEAVELAKEVSAWINARDAALAREKYTDRGLFNVRFPRLGVRAFHDHRMIADGSHDRGRTPLVIR